MREKLVCVLRCLGFMKKVTVARTAKERVLTVGVVCGLE